MQALCQPHETVIDVRCPVCSKGFRLYWERTDKDRQTAAMAGILMELQAHHERGEHGSSHPETSFTVPHWAGQPRFSGAALLGGAH